MLLGKPVAFKIHISFGEHSRLRRQGTRGYKVRRKVTS